jgi:hypothetical protein
MASAPEPPRALTPEIRAELGLPAVSLPPYRWSFAALLVGAACVPLMLAKLWSMCALAFAIGFLILPFVRWLETREAFWREEVYRSGKEITGRVLDVEPAGPGRTDHIVRLEFRADGDVVRSSVIGCPLARRGLLPDDDVVIVYAPERPTRCLVLRKVPRTIVDAIFDD